MTRAGLTDQLHELCERSGLSVSEKAGALRAALTRVQMNVSSRLAAQPQSGFNMEEVARLQRDAIEQAAKIFESSPDDIPAGLQSRNAIEREGALLAQSRLARVPPPEAE